LFTDIQIIIVLYVLLNYLSNMYRLVMYHIQI